MRPAPAVSLGPRAGQLLRRVAWLAPRAGPMHGCPVATHPTLVPAVCCAIPVTVPMVCTMGVQLPGLQFTLC